MEEVGRILPSVVGRHMQNVDARLVQVLRALWPRAVGKRIAEHSLPMSFVSGTLTLATACPSWAAQLGQMREEVRAGINGFLGKRLVRKVKIRHTPSLVSEHDQSQTGTRNGALEAGQSKLPRSDLKPALELATLDPEIARFVEEAYLRYFSEAAKSPRRGPDW